MKVLGFTRRKQEEEKLVNSEKNNISQFVMSSLKKQILFKN
jgi:hypothetical protein